MWFDDDRVQHVIAGLMVVLVLAAILVPLLWSNDPNKPHDPSKKTSGTEITPSPVPFSDLLEDDEYDIFSTTSLAPVL